MFEHLSLFF